MRQRFYTAISVNKRTRINSIIIIFFFFSSFSPAPVLHSTAVSVSRPLSPPLSTPQPGQHAAEYFYNRNVRHAPCFHISYRNVHHAESGRQLNLQTPATPTHPTPTVLLLLNPGVGEERGGRGGKTSACDPHQGCVILCGVEALFPEKSITPIERGGEGAEGDW